MTVLLRAGDRSPAVRLFCLAATVAVLGACGGPRQVPLAELAANADYYDGREIVAQGVVLEFGEEDDAIERHFVLQDASVTRVQLLPADVAERHVGRAVRVRGGFEFDQNRGRRLHVDSVEAVGAGS